MIQELVYKNKNITIKEYKDLYRVYNQETLTGEYNNFYAALRSVGDNQWIINIPVFNAKKLKRLRH